jgi:hypothetical protein
MSQMRSHAGTVLVGCGQVIRGDGDQPAVTDFYLVIMLDQTLGLATVLGAVASSAKHRNHRIRSLPLRKFAVLTRMIGQFIFRKGNTGHDVCSHEFRPFVWR